MKNQYFGDVNDYRKYGLLRTLSNNGNFRIGICWMLTADDDRQDGKFTNYLNDPQRWRQYDSSLFDLLHQWIISEHNRNVRLVQSANAVPGAEFYNDLLLDSASHRTAYFNQAKEKLASCDLIFYDPDNGIETKSITKGKRDSAKFIYWDEVCQTFEAGHSILVYQHFPREKHEAFIRRMVDEYQSRLNASKVYWFCTPQVVYFLGVQGKHLSFIIPRVRLVAEQWVNQIQVG